MKQYFGERLEFHNRFRHLVQNETQEFQTRFLRFANVSSEYLFNVRDKSSEKMSWPAVQGRITTKIDFTIKNDFFNIRRTNRISSYRNLIFWETRT